MNALRRQHQELFDLRRARIPQVTVVLGIFDQNLVRTQRAHAVVQAIRAAGWLSLDAIKWRWMYHRPRGPRASINRRHAGNHLRSYWRLGTERAHRTSARRLVGNIVSCDNPRACDGI